MFMPWFARIEGLNKDGLDLEWHSNLYERLTIDRTRD